MMKLFAHLALAMARSKNAVVSCRRLLALITLIAALAFSGCAMNDHYSPISGHSAGSPGFGGGG